MTKQMEQLLTRVDGVSRPIGPIHIFGPGSTPSGGTAASASPRSHAARGRAQRLARTRAGERRGRVPRGLEALLLSEPSDLLVHEDLVAAGLL